MNAPVQIIEKDGKPEYAVVPYEEFRRLLQLAEDAEDIRAADAAQRELQNGEDEAVPADVVEQLLNGQQHPLRVWREYRGFTQEVLAQMSGVGKSYISQIEAGKKTGSAKVLRSIAKALEVEVEDLLGA